MSRHITAKSLAAITDRVKAATKEPEVRTNKSDKILLLVALNAAKRAAFSGQRSHQFAVDDTADFEAIQPKLEGLGYTVKAQEVQEPDGKLTHVTITW